MNDEFLLSEYQKQNPADFVMAELLGDVVRLKNAMGQAETRYVLEQDPKKQLKQLDELAKLQKQHLETVKVIAKFQETTYHAAIKAKRANKSAAPGQQVGQAMPVRGAGSATTAVSRAEIPSSEYATDRNGENQQ